MTPKNETQSKVDVRSSPPVKSGMICAVIARVLEKGGSVVAIVPAGFMRSDGVVLPNQTRGTVDVQRIFWTEPHEEQPKDPDTGELRIGKNGT